MYCNKCGSDVPEGSKTCPECGAEITVAMLKDQGKATLKAASAQAKSEFRDAKAVYKRARRAAGKSRTPLVIFFIILFLLFFAAGAFGMWWYLDNYNPSWAPKSVAAQDEATDEDADDESKDEATATSTAVSSEEEDLVGLWEAKEFVETSSGTSKSCFGGKVSRSDIQVEILSISKTGKVTANATVVYHGHDRSTLTSDSNSSEGDTKQEWKSLSGTYANGVITFEHDENDFGDGSKITIVCTLKKSSYGKDTMELEVTSDYQLSSVSTVDKYTLSKAEGEALG